jgi:hypothetical protein
MVYSDYSLFKIEEEFNLKNRVISLFQNIIPIEPSEWLIDSLKTAQELPVRSEKAKSELIIMPILLEMRNRNDKYFTIYSGDYLNIDESLKGECDFIISKDTQSFDINFPILQVVEAKKNDTQTGIPQCAAQMIGAKKYNEKRGNTTINVIYGCVTTGDDWIFMKLENEILIDTKKYYLGNLSELLGVFQFIISEFRSKE